METGKKLVLNTFIPLILHVVTIISGFIIPRLILASFGSEVNGLVTSITQFLSIIGFTEMGIGSVVRYNMYGPLASGDSVRLSSVYVSAQRYFRTIALILLGYVTVLSFVYPLLVESQFDRLFTILLILVLSITSFAQYFFGQVNSILLIADQKSYVFCTVQIFAIIVNTVMCALLIRLGAGIHLVKLAASVIFAIKPVFMHLYVKRRYAIDRKVRFSGEPIRQKWNGMAQHISNVVLEQTDVIVLTSLSTLTNVSVYSIYYLVVSSIKSLLMSATNGIEAYIGTLIAKKETEQLKKTFNLMEWTIHTVTTFVYSCTMVLIVPFVLVYTDGINDANYNVPLFALLITLANAGHCLRLPYSILILNAGHYKQTQWNYIFCALLNIAVSVILVWKLGLVGVAIGTIVAMSFQTIWMAWYTARNIISRSALSFLKQISVDALSFVGVFFAAKLFSMQTVSYLSWIVLAIKVALSGLLISVAVNVLFFRRNISSMLEMLRGRRNET